MPSVAELIKALPDLDERTDETEGVAPASLRPVPVGRLRRLGMLGSLQAKIGAAYLFYWIRGWFRSAAERERLLAETHWKTAARLLDSMSYLRGAVMKMGQTLANFPDIAPRQFVETLDQLHFDAPPMHWSLLREMVANELGDDPQRLFASFDRQAFAAASLGQVHKARLHTGEEVVVKIQYPGIARTIREDLRNLTLFMFPSRVSREWESVKAQMDELCFRLELETDYAAEADALSKVGRLMREDDHVVVPRVFPDFSTSRVLTMERIDGLHMEGYLARGPSQEERDLAAVRLVRAWYRMMYTGRLLYIDFHPGNILFLDDGRVGLLDFGMMLPLEGDLWEAMRIIDRALTTGRREDRLMANKAWCGLTDAEWDLDRQNLMDAYADSCWRARYCGGEFDFGDDADFRQSVDLFSKMVARRYAKARPCTPLVARSQFGWRSILYRLKARFDIRPIAEQEIKATGWDRSEYA
jgi:predicted unusual protein kinase regulating ubiquinone biosynthesis (AarF/ABC1/UbiB family)